MRSARPRGQAVVLMSDAGGGSPGVSNVTISFDDAATNTMPTTATVVTGGIYRPTNIDTTETAPAGTVGGLGTALAAFTTSTVNGTWKLFVNDDASGDTGSIQSWTVNFDVLATGMPSTQTLAVSSVSGDTVKLNASVNPNGSPTNMWFEYGTTTSYGSATATQAAGSGTSLSSITTPLANLIPGAVYHFRAVAANATGTSFGADMTFTAAKVYYVNDTALTNDIWCIAAGNDANDGLTPATPKATVQAIARRL